MPIAVTCPTCHARTKAPDAAAGRKAKCPKCGSAVPVPAPEDIPEENDDPIRPTEPRPRRGRKKLLVIAGVITLIIAVVGVGSLLVWNSVAESRRQAKAEQAVRNALDRWCSGEPLGDLGNLQADHSFEDPALTDKMRPQRYEITGVKPGKKDTYEVNATLTFIAGPETRVYEVHLFKKSGKSLVTTKASEDVSGTEAHARSILQAWLGCWASGEDMATFKHKHPEAAAKMTADVTWASLSSAGKRLVSYDITNAAPTPKGYRFTVTAVIDDKGTPETKILYYEVFKDRTLSEGRWTVVGK